MEMLEAPQEAAGTCRFCRCGLNSHHHLWCFLGIAVVVLMSWSSLLVGWRDGSRKFCWLVKGMVILTGIFFLVESMQSFDEGLFEVVEVLG